MPNLPPNISQYPVQKFGLEGLNTFDDPSDIQDIELADIRNMVFSDGLLQPREGSLLYMTKPTGETQAPAQILVATTSDGIDYNISVYGNNFYLIDTTNGQWIKINQAYTPFLSGLFYGSVNFNSGISNDRFFFGNGSEDNMKWTMAVSNLSVAALSADTKLFLKSSTRFPGNPKHPLVTNTATTIAFVAAGHEITDSANGFITAGFRSGMSIKVSGTSSNNSIFTIVSVTPGVIVVKEAVANEAVGGTVTVDQIGIALVQNAGTPFTLYYTSVDTVYTASTISFTTPHTISDSANGFVSAGFKAGQTITVSGTALNNTTFTIVTVAAGVITVSETVDTEIAGQSITITTPSLNLNGTVGQNVPIGSTVTIPIVDMGDMPMGKVFTTFQTNRLIVSNYLGKENTINVSKFRDPEDFDLTDTSINRAVASTVNKGKGGIIGIDDFGEYLLIEKQDILIQYSFAINSAGDNFSIVTTPIINGDGIGPVQNATKINYMNTLYYPTSKQGIISFSPTATGGQTTSGLQVFSQKINNLITEVLNFSNSRTCGLAQKLYWAVSLPTVGIESNINNLVISYDLVRASQNPTQSAWTVFDNWNAVDIKPVNNVLYYLSLNDGAVYQCNVTGNYQDAILDNPVAYTAMALSKRFNLNAPANLMRPVYAYVEGYVSLNTTFYCNMLFNENGSLGNQTYEIAGTNTDITSSVFSGGLGRFILASPVLGGVDLGTLQEFQKPLFFRVYLELTQAFRDQNLQLQFFSNELGSFWGISKIVLMTLPEPSINTGLVMSPSAVPMLTIPSL